MVNFTIYRDPDSPHGNHPQPQRSPLKELSPRSTADRLPRGPHTPLGTPPATPPGFPSRRPLAAAANAENIPVKISPSKLPIWPLLIPEEVDDQDESMPSSPLTERISPRRQSESPSPRY